MNPNIWPPIIFKAIVAILLIVGSTAPLVLYAHGTGASIEQVIDNYLIDIGYSPESVAAGAQVRFDFNVLNQETNAPEAFTDIWLRIEKEGATLFAGGIHKPVFGQTGITYIFPDRGTYTINVRFQNEGDKIVETSFPLEVLGTTDREDEGGGKNPLGVFFIGIVLGVLIGGTLTFMIKRK